MTLCAFGSVFSVQKAFVLSASRVASASKSDSFENIKATISDYVSRVEKYDEEYGTSFIKNIEKLKKYSENKTNHKNNI